MFFLQPRQKRMLDYFKKIKDGVHFEKRKDGDVAWLEETNNKTNVFEFWTWNSNFELTLTSSLETCKKMKFKETFKIIMQNGDTCSTLKINFRKDKVLTYAYLWLQLWLKEC